MKRRICHLFSKPGQIGIVCWASRGEKPGSSLLPFQFSPTRCGLGKVGLTNGSHSRGDQLSPNSFVKVKVLKKAIGGG